MRQVTSPISSMYVRYKLPQRFGKVEDSTSHSRMKNTCPQGRQVSKHGIFGFKFLNLRHKHPIGQITPSLPQPKDNIHFCERAHQANDSENKRSGGDSYSNQYGQYSHDQRPPSTL